MKVEVARAAQGRPTGSCLVPSQIQRRCVVALPQVVSRGGHGKAEGHYEQDCAFLMNSDLFKVVLVGVGHCSAWHNRVIFCI